MDKKYVKQRLKGMAPKERRGWIEEKILAEGATATPVLDTLSSWGDGELDREVGARKGREENNKKRRARADQWQQAMREILPDARAMNPKLSLLELVSNFLYAELKRRQIPEKVWPDKKTAVQAAKKLHLFRR